MITIQLHACRIMGTGLLLCLMAGCVADLPVEDPDLYVFAEDPDALSQDPHDPNVYGYSYAGGNDVLAEDIEPPPPCNVIQFKFMDPTPSEVAITGTFDDWAFSVESGATALDWNDTDGYWETTITFEEDAYGQHHYAFVIDQNELVADPLGQDKIAAPLGGEYSIINICDTTPAPSCPAAHFVTSQNDATQVLLAGSFTDWELSPVPMIQHGANWHLFITLGTGVFPYKYVVDGDWIHDSANPYSEDDTLGGLNSLAYVDCGAVSSGCGDLESFDWRDAVMYFAMIDRFHDSDGESDPVVGASGFDGYGSSAQYEGGDLLGVQDRLDYLVDLGISAIWLSAPYENRDTPGAGMNPEDAKAYSAYHGYWPSPENVVFQGENANPEPKVESRIGTKEDLHSLIDTAHETETANGTTMRVLFDYVMNHVDDESALFQAHPDWFYPTTEEYLCANKGWGIDCTFTTYLPAFDFYQNDARKWSIDDALWWARTYDVDGYRLDAIKHVPMSWLTDLRTALNEEFPSPAGNRFYLVGETYTWHEYDVLGSFVEPNTKLDGQFDFPWRKEVCNATMGSNGFDNLRSFLDINDKRYGPDALMSTWLGNHDIPRVIHAANGQFSCTDGSYGAIAWTPNYTQPNIELPYKKLALGYALMFTNPGLPMVYYGDEIGLAGGGDPDNRRVMPWNDDDLNAHQIQLRQEFGFLANLRGQYKSITRGSRSTLFVDHNTWLYRMGGCGGDTTDIMVALNRGSSQATLSLPEGNYIDLFSQEVISGGEINLPSISYRIFSVQ